MSEAEKPSLAITLRILSGILMAGMFVSVKMVSDSVPLGEIVFFRSAFAIIPLVIFLWLRREFPNGLATKRPIDHLIRSSFGALALFGSFAAISMLNLAEAILIAQLSPILMAIAAVLVLGERLTVWRIGGVALGFLGVIVLVWPELADQTNASNRLTGYAVGLAAALLSAFALIMVRSLNKTESPGAIALYFVLTSMVGALLTIPWGWLVPTPVALIWLICAGLFGGLGHIAMTLAFRYAEASRLAAFEYIALLWPLLADLVIFGFQITTPFLLSAPLILAGAVFAVYEGKNKQV